MEQLKLRVRNGICICFTAQGKETATRLLEKLSQQMEEAFDFLDYTGSEHSKPLKQVVKEAFQEKEAILFVGAAGIAVRLIAAVCPSYDLQSIWKIRRLCWRAG